METKVEEKGEGGTILMFWVGHPPQLEGVKPVQGGGRCTSREFTQKRGSDKGPSQCVAREWILALSAGIHNIRVSALA